MPSIQPARYALLPQRGLLRLSGGEVKAFLQGLVSTDVTTVTPQRAIYAALLSPQGKFLHDFFVVEHAGSLWLDCVRARQDDLARRLALYKLRAKIDIADANPGHAVAAAFGGEVLVRLGLADGLGSARAALGGIAYGDPRLAELGARLILPAAGAAASLEGAGLLPAGGDDYDRMRLELGVPDGGIDLEIDKALLLENNFEGLHGVDFTKGCFVGQELTARTKHRGLIKKRLYQVDIEGPTPPPDTVVMLGDKEAGVMRSARGGLGLALLRLEQVGEAESTGQALRANGAKLRPKKPAWAGF
jgi:folate-binding protein YgfZ